MTQRLVCESCDAGYDTSLTTCPYCGCSNQMAHTVTLTPLVMDTECYAHYWLCSFLDPATMQLVCEFHLFEGWSLDRIGLRNVLTKHTIVTFNGIKYDFPMLTYAMSGASNAEIKAASDTIITQQMRPWDFYRAYGLTVPTSIDHIDLIEVLPGQGSLKAYGGKMHTRRLQDLPYGPDTVIGWPERLMLREYCKNDLVVTAEAFNMFTAQIALRVQMSEEYGVDLRSKSDAQIAEAVMKSLLPFDVQRPNIPAGTSFNYDPPEWLHFTTPYLQRVLRDICAAPFSVTPTGSVSPSMNNHWIDWSDEQVRLDLHGEFVKCPKDWKQTPIQIGETLYAFGSGGLHSMESCVTYRADPKYSLRSPDVAAYYPSLIVRLAICPPQIGQLFVTTYRDWKLRRDTAKIAKDKETANSRKTLNNGTFGKLLSKWSIFYTPQGGINVTITGQLALLMLIEALEGAGVRVVSANTDGIVIYNSRSMDWIADQIVAWWESVTGFVMEMTDFSLLAARDVNSYVALTTDGEVKLKGAMAPPLPGASGWPNPTGQICVDAVVAYLQYGTPMADTIRACTDIRQFVHVRSVTGGGSYCSQAPLPRKASQKAMRAALGWADKQGSKDELLEAYAVAVEQSRAQREYLGKVVRWIYSTGSTGCIVTPEGNLVPRTSGCRPMMELPDAVPDDLDYDWYITEAKSIFNGTGGTL